MDLPTYIRSIGVDKAAELFEESPRAIKGWLYGERRPRPAKAEKIVQRTKGRVTFKGIYGGSAQ